MADWHSLGLRQLISALVFTGTRMAGLMVFAPFTGSDAISIPVKAVLTVLVTALIYPISPFTGVNSDAMGWLRIAAFEAVIGLALGLMLQFILEAAQFAGQIFGIQTGFSLVTLLDPQTQADSASLSVFTQLMVLLLFLQMNVHHWLLRGVVKSFAYLPPGSLGNFRGIVMGVLLSAGGVWLAGMQMAAPVVAVTLLADVALGFVGKAAPQLPASLAGLPVKSLIGLTVMAFAAASWPRFFEHQFASAISGAERVLYLAK